MKPSGKDRRMTRKGSIFLPSTSVLDSDKWRPPFSKLSKRTTLLLSYVAADVVSLINEELESSRLRDGGNKPKKTEFRKKAGISELPALKEQRHGRISSSVAKSGSG